MEEEEEPLLTDKERSSVEVGRRDGGKLEKENFYGATKSCCIEMVPLKKNQSLFLVLLLPPPCGQQHDFDARIAVSES